MVNPLDTIESIAAANDWSCERADAEITMLVGGKWSDYQVSFTWMEDIEALHLACAFDFKIPSHRLDEVHRLVAMINEQLWIGHFDLWLKDGMVMFRYALLLSGEVQASSHQCQAMLNAGLEACENYFPAFQYVVWAGKPAQQALEASMFETQGEA